MRVLPRLAVSLLLATCAASPRPAGARSAMEALTRGLTYPLQAVPYCTAPDAVARLVALRKAGDLDNLPDGCVAPDQASFARQFRGFIPDHKVAGLSVREKLLQPNRFGRYACPAPAEGALATCDLRIIRAGFVAGSLVRTDSSKTKAYLEVGFGIEVMDPNSGDLVFAPLPAAADNPPGQATKSPITH